jgi:thiol-disulfide isomerase/thioredoxin
MPSLYSRLLLIVTLVICSGLIVACASAAETGPDGRQFQPSIDPLADVQQALDRAEKSDRLALVVLGANWCHDSRALASRLNQSPLAELIEQHYELVFVDVGYYETGREVLQQFGVAHFYATPTVLIIDPSNRALVNDEDRHLWSNAYNIDMSSSVRYFEKWAMSDLSAESVANPVADSTQLTHLYAEIDQFEQQLAERVAAGYAVVGPMLAAYEAGNAPEEFDASWDELREFRMAIPDAIRELRDEAQRRVSEGEKIFSWCLRSTHCCRGSRSRGAPQ